MNNKKLDEDGGWLIMNNRERDNKIFEMRNNGHTLSEIGNLFGVSRERVRQICRKEKNRLDKKYDSFCDSYNLFDVFCERWREEGYDMDWLIKFSKRTMYALVRANIKTLDDLYTVIKNNIGIRNLGKNGWAEIVKIINDDNIIMLKKPQKIETLIRLRGGHTYKENHYKWVSFKDAEK